MIVKHVQSKRTGQNLQSERQTVHKRIDKQTDKQKDGQLERRANGQLYRGEREREREKERERERERERYGWRSLKIINYQLRKPIFLE